jgi:hypothetical protein
MVLATKVTNSGIDSENLGKINLTCTLSSGEGPAKTNTQPTNHPPGLIKRRYANQPSGGAGGSSRLLCNGLDIRLIQEELLQAENMEEAPQATATLRDVYID